MENKQKYNDLSTIPVELFDDGVNYGMCYKIQADEKTRQSIVTIIDKAYELCRGEIDKTSVSKSCLFIPISIFLNALVGAGVYDGHIMGYDVLPDGSLIILTICRGDAIVPFRDCMLKVFPEIDYIEVLN
jgi:hypothetical protein